MTLSVLVVDDMESNRLHFQRIFLQLGIYALAADSAEQALQVLEKSPVDVIFLDYNMPGMNGFEFAKLYGAEQREKTVPIIMMSTDRAINELAVRRGLAKAWVEKRAAVGAVENALVELGLW